MILCNLIKIDDTASTGSASGTFTATGLCRQILCVFTTSTTTFDFTITDANSVDIYESTSEVGVLNDFVTMPVAGTYSYTIANATVDEALEIMIGVQNS